jgi:hypothetical protein
MALKTTYENAQDIPEGMETLYTEGDSGSFNLTEVEGMIDKGRLDEFRDNNIQLRKDIEAEQANTAAANLQLEQRLSDMKALEEKFSNIDMDEWQSLQDKKRSVEDQAKAIADKKLIDAGDVDTLINQRVEEVLAVKAREYDELKKGYEDKVFGLEDNLSKYDVQLNTMLVDGEISRFASENGVRGSALEDVLHRGRSLFKVEDGQAMAFDETGRKVYAEDAVTPLTISGWLGELAESAPHLFEASTGAGSVQQVSQPAQPKQDPTSTHDLLMAGLANIGME